MTEIVIKTKERRTTLVTPKRDYDYAWAIVKGSKRVVELGFSKFDHEDEWKLDTMFDNRLPVFSHGEGSRSCLKQKASAELLEAIEAAEFTEVEA